MSLAEMKATTPGMASAALASMATMGASGSELST
jgi:hypothetical protein